MSEPIRLVIALGAGGGLGALFFGGLWWTVRSGLASPAPALWFLGSLLLRTGITVAGFILVSGGHWDRALACLLGFLTARVAVTRLTRDALDVPSRKVPGAKYAP